MEEITRCANCGCLIDLHECEDYRNAFGQLVQAGYISEDGRDMPVCRICSEIFSAEEEEWARESDYGASEDDGEDDLPEIDF
jgi:hypothetical protein